MHDFFSMMTLFVNFSDASLQNVTFVLTHFVMPRMLSYATTCRRQKQVKQNSTNNLTLFFSTVFNALPGGVLHFAGCVAIETHFLERS